MESIRPNHPLRRLFSGLVEQTFCTEVGLCDPELTGYLSDLLVSFTHVDRLNAIRNARGKRPDDIAAMLIAMSDDFPEDETQRDRALYRHIGDYTLFWAGVYPEQLQQDRSCSSDVLLEYVTQGKQSYAIVSKLTEEDESSSHLLFQYLSEEFECCAHGLGLVRKGWENSSLRSELGGRELLL